MSLAFAGCLPNKQIHNNHLRVIGGVGPQESWYLDVPPSALARLCSYVPAVTKATVLCFLSDYFAYGVVRNSIAWERDQKLTKLRLLPNKRVGISTDLNHDHHYSVSFEAFKTHLKLLTQVRLISAMDLGRTLLELLQLPLKHHHKYKKLMAFQFYLCVRQLTSKSKRKLQILSHGFLCELVGLKRLKYLDGTISTEQSLNEYSTKQFIHWLNSTAHLTWSNLKMDRNVSTLAIRNQVLHGLRVQSLNTHLDRSIILPALVPNTNSVISSSLHCLSLNCGGSSTPIWWRGHVFNQLVSINLPNLRVFSFGMSREHELAHEATDFILSAFEHFPKLDNFQWVTSRLGNFLSLETYNMSFEHFYRIFNGTIKRRLGVRCECNEYIAITLVDVTALGATRIKSVIGQFRKTLPKVQYEIQGKLPKNAIKEQILISNLLTVQKLLITIQNRVHERPAPIHGPLIPDVNPALLPVFNFQNA